MVEDRLDAQIRDMVAQLAASAPPPPAYSRIVQRMPDAALRVHQLPTSGDAALGDRDAVEVAPPPYVRESSRSRPWRLMAALVAFGLAATGGLFAYGSLHGDDGAPTPEKAVERFVHAFTDSDVAGMLEALPPSERVVLRESLESLNGQASRLRLTKNLDLNHVQGVKLEVDGLRLAATGVGPDLASVDVKGTLRSSASDRVLPLGDVARDLLKDSLPKDGYQGVAEALAKAINGGDVRLVTLREAGGWHVSVWYTLAEYLRRYDGFARPNFGHSPIAPVGASSPEGAVKALLETGDDFNKAVSMTTPGESRVLYDYVPVFVKRTPHFVETTDYRVHRLGARVEGSGDRRIVHIDSYDIEWSSTDGTTRRETFDGNCYRSTATYGSTTAPGGADVYALCRSDAQANRETRLEWKLLSTLQATVERHDGRWFVSPVRSLVGQTVARLAEVPDGGAFTSLGSTKNGIGAAVLLPFDLFGLAIGTPYNAGQFSSWSSAPESSWVNSGRSGGGSTPTPTTVMKIRPSPDTTAPGHGG